MSTNKNSKDTTTKTESIRKPLPQSNISSTRKEIFDLSRKVKKSNG